MGSRPPAVEPLPPPLLVLLSSRSSDSTVHTFRSFEKYRTAGSLDIDIVTDRDRALKSIRSAGEGGGTVVFWDASAGVPPKEIEALLNGLAPGEWRIGIRVVGAPKMSMLKALPACLGKAMRIFLSWTGRRLEPGPPCIATPRCAAFGCIDRLASSSETEWIGILCAAARRDRARVTEAPVMSSAKRSGAAGTGR